MPRLRRTKQTGLASLACIGCRKQHLKCDGKRPTCLRCLQNGHNCHYQPSRRGGRRSPLPVQHESSHSEPLLPPSAHCPSATSSTEDAATAPVCSSIASSSSPKVSSSAPASGDSTAATEPGAPPPGLAASLNVFNTAGEAAPSPADESISSFSNLTSDQLPWATSGSDDLDRQAPPNSVSGPWCDGDRFTRLFYENFHSAHPILVPGPMYASQLYPTHLRLVVDFVGSHYVQLSPSEQLKKKVISELTSSSDRSSHMVQSLLLYSIVLFSRGDLSEAHKAFAQCSEIALELGMNRADFARSRHPERSIEAESLRRTWWELFVVDILLAIPLRTISFHFSSVSHEVPLPCEESCYTGTREIPQPQKFLDFKRRVLAAKELSFSSFSYRIDAATILSQVLVLNRLKEYHRDHIFATENALINWTNHLPAEKLDIMDSYGNMDKMMFQAHTIITYANMLLHLPLSRFYPLLSSTHDPFLPFTQLHSSSTSTRFIQSIKATDASRRMSDYMALCPNIQKHTPLIIPALGMCGLIQLATSTSHSEDCFGHHYNRVALVLGCLKNVKRVWRLAESAYRQVQSCAVVLISDSLDRLNSEPFSRSIALTQSTPSTSSHSNKLAVKEMAQGSEASVLSDLDLSFIDPICHNYSLFGSLLDIQHL